MTKSFAKSIEISKQYKFEAAHRVLSQTLSPRLCHNVHGHSYVIVVELQAHDLNDEDMVIDYGYMDMIVKPIVDKLDHSYLLGDLDDESMLKSLSDLSCRLNKIPGKSPTAENISRFIAQEILEGLFKLPDKQGTNIKRIRVTVKETEKTSARTTLLAN